MKRAKAKSRTSSSVLTEDSKASKLTYNSKSIIVALVVLCGLSMLAYANSLHVPFVFDDGASVERNPGVRFGYYLSQSVLQMRSILYMTFALNHKLGDMDPWGYHVVNLALHLLNGGLVFFIAHRLFKKAGIKSDVIWLAGISAAAFLIHPVQTESVTYISSRSELLSTLFYASAFLIFVSWPEEKIGFVLAGAIAVLYGLGLVSKETVITLPATLLLYDWIFISRASLRPILQRWRFYAVFVVLGITGCIVLFKQWRTFFKPDPLLLSSWPYFLTQTRVLVRYLYLLIFPVGLNLDYDFRISTSILELAVLLCLAVSIVLVSAAIYWRKSRPLVAFAILWFYITLAPTSSFMPIQDVIFEHRLYLPLVGVCILFGVFIRQRVIACSVLALLLIGTISRNYTWGDELRLYNDIVSKSPGKARAYNALIMTYGKRGAMDQAIATAQTGISKVPASDRYLLTTLLGNLYMQSARYDDAIKVYKDALGGGDLSATYNNLGVAYWRKWQQIRAGRSAISDSDFAMATQEFLSNAEAAFRESYSQDSSNLASLDSYIDVRHDRGDSEAWKAELQAKLAKQETFETLYSLGKIDWLNHEFEPAVELFSRAMSINSEYKLLHYNYAYALAQIDRTNVAIDEYLAAIHRDPTFWEAHFNVALLYLKKSDLQNAIIHFNEVLRLNPDHSPTLVYLARLFIQQKEPARARPYLQEALRINPRDPEALRLLQSLGS